MFLSRWAKDIKQFVTRFSNARRETNNNYTPGMNNTKIIISRVWFMNTHNEYLRLDESNKSISAYSALEGSKPEWWLKHLKGKPTSDLFECVVSTPS